MVIISTELGKLSSPKDCFVEFLWICGSWLWASRFNYKTAGLLHTHIRFGPAQLTSLSYNVIMRSNNTCTRKKTSKLKDVSGLRLNHFNLNLFFFDEKKLLHQLVGMILSGLWISIQKVIIKMQVRAGNYAASWDDRRPYLSCPRRRPGRLQTGKTSRGIHTG